MTKAAKIEHTLGVVPVDGRQEAEELGEGGAPVGPLQVVARALSRPVPEIGNAGDSRVRLCVVGLPLDFAPWSHQEGGAVLGDQGGSCVDQRKTICNRVLCQPILLRQESAKQR